MMFAFMLSPLKDMLETPVRLSVHSKNRLICYEKCIATFFCQNNMEVCHFNRKVNYFDVN